MVPQHSLLAGEFREHLFSAPYHFHPEYERVLILKGSSKRYIGHHQAACSERTGTDIRLNKKSDIKSNHEFYIAFSKESGITVEPLISLLTFLNRLEIL